MWNATGYYNHRLLAMGRVPLLSRVVGTGYIADALTSRFPGSSCVGSGPAHGERMS